MNAGGFLELLLPGADVLRMTLLAKAGFSAALLDAYMHRLLHR